MAQRAEPQERPEQVLPRHLCSPPPPWMTIDEVSERLSRPVNTLRRWRREGKGPVAVRDAGGTLIYPASEIVRYEQGLADKLRQQLEDLQAGPGARTGQVQRHRRPSELAVS